MLLRPQPFITTLDVDGATTLDQVTISTADGAFAVGGANAATVDSNAALTLGGLTVAAEADGGVMDLDASAALSLNSSAGANKHR